MLYIKIITISYFFCSELIRGCVSSCCFFGAILALVYMKTPIKAMTIPVYALYIWNFDSHFEGNKMYPMTSKRTVLKWPTTWYVIEDVFPIKLNVDRLTPIAKTHVKSINKMSFIDKRALRKPFSPVASMSADAMQPTPNSGGATESWSCVPTKSSSSRKVHQSSKALLHSTRERLIQRKRIIHKILNLR